MFFMYILAAAEDQMYVPLSHLLEGEKKRNKIFLKIYALATLCHSSTVCSTAPRTVDEVAFCGCC